MLQIPVFATNCYMKRATRFFSNEKRKTKDARAMKSDRAIITRFFSRHRRFTERQLFLREKQKELQVEIDRRKVKGEDNRGLSFVIHKDAWDNLNEDEQREWEERADEQNTKSENGLSDEDVQK